MFLLFLLVLGAQRILSLVPCLLVSVLVPYYILLSFDYILYACPGFVITLVFLVPHIKLVYLAFFILLGVVNQSQCRMDKPLYRYEHFQAWYQAILLPKFLLFYLFSSCLGLFLLIFTHFFRLLAVDLGWWLNLTTLPTCCNWHFNWPLNEPIFSISFSRRAPDGRASSQESLRSKRSASQPSTTNNWVQEDLRKLIAPEAIDVETRATSESVPKVRYQGQSRLQYRLY